MIDLN